MAGMGWRFSRRIRILPGIRVNLSRSGVSTSVGGRGFWFTTGNGRRRTTVGLPGSGLSYTTVRTQHGDRPVEGQPRRGLSPWVWVFVLLATLLAVAMLSSCGRAPPAQAPVVRDTAMHDYEMQERCARTAREWFKQFLGSGLTVESGSRVETSYTNHYNAKLNRCFAATTINGSLTDAKTGKASLSLAGTLLDVQENRPIGDYFKFIAPAEKLMSCEMDGKPCQSSGEWDALAKPYMEQ